METKNRVILFSIAIPVYILTALYFLQIAYLHPNASPIWPLSGLSIGLLVIYGLENCIIILIGSFIANLVTSFNFDPDATLYPSLFSCLGIALSNTLETWVGAWMLIKFANGIHCLDKAADTAKLLSLVSFIPSLFSAFGGASSLYLFGLIEPPQYANIVTTWYTANVYGILLCTPALLILFRPISGQISWQQVIEFFIVFALLIIVGETISGVYFSNYFIGWPKSYMIIPVILWVGFRFGYLGLLISLLALSTNAFTGTFRGYQAFPSDDPNQALLYLQVFLGILCIIGWSFVALVTELTLSNANLDKKVAMRTRRIDELLEHNKKLMLLFIHDMHSPILGFLNLLKLRNDPEINISPSQWEKILDEMESSCMRIEAMINQGLSSMENNSIIDKIVFENHNLNALTRYCILPYQSRKNEKNIQIQTDIMKYPAVAKTDKICLQRIIDNLISNAIKYSPNNSQITVKTFTENGFFCLIVKDQGAGFSKHELQDMFHLFSRFGPASNEASSFGIGLYSVNNLVKGLHGEISCESVKGLGSEFLIKFPLS